MTRIGIALPQTSGDTFDHEHLRRYLEQAEAVGYDSVWAAEMHGAPILDPLGLLAFSAAVTRGVRLGVAVILTNLRAPLQLARDIATLDQLSGGRVDLGIGLGADPAVLARHGLPTDRRVGRFVAGIWVLEQLWAGEPVTAADGWWQLDGVTLHPRPIQRPHPPVWIGARSTAGLARAVRLGDGWIGAGTWPLAELAPAVAALRRELDGAGRDPETFGIGRKVFVHMDHDPARARDTVAAHFGRLGRPIDIDTLAVYGTPSECVDRLGELGAVGLDLLILNPVTDQLDQAEQLMTELSNIAAGAPT